MPHPYTDLPAQAFWRTGVVRTDRDTWPGLYVPKVTLTQDTRIATFGSCFAQHLGPALRAAGCTVLDVEPAPRAMTDDVARRFGYGQFSARTGNIYTAAQLLTHVELAAGTRDPESIEIWPDGPLYRDSLRPVIEPTGFANPTDLQLSRASMVRGFRRSIAGAEVFVFTLGLTEGWENIQTGQCYPLCPGTVAGQFDAGQHRFYNYQYPDIRAALQAAFDLMWGINPTLRILLTVSPVPLTATASGQHVLSATTYSKSTLRAVAGDLAGSDPRIDYFPSYEIIMGAPTRAAFFEPNLRSVAAQGVEFVMGHFFRGLNTTAPAVHGQDPGPADRERAVAAQMAADELVCEEMTLEKFNAA